MHFYTINDTVSKKSMKKWHDLWKYVPWKSNFLDLPITKIYSLKKSTAKISSFKVTGYKKSFLKLSVNNFWILAWKYMKVYIFEKQRFCATQSYQ